jgi:hypothetical protein
MIIGLGHHTRDDAALIRHAEAFVDTGFLDAIHDATAPSTDRGPDPALLAGIFIPGGIRNGKQV